MAWQKRVSELLFSSQCLERRLNRNFRHFKQLTGTQQETPFVILSCLRRSAFSDFLPVYFQVTSSRTRLLSSGRRFFSQDQQWTCWSVGEIMKKLEQTNQTQQTMKEQPQSESAHSSFINYSSHSAVSKLTEDQNKLVCENHSSSLWINAITSVMKRNPSLQALPVVWRQEVTRCGTQGILHEVERLSQRSQLIWSRDLQLFTTSDSLYSDSQSRDGSQSNFLF